MATALRFVARDGRLPRKSIGIRPAPAPHSVDTAPKIDTPDRHSTPPREGPPPNAPRCERGWAGLAMTVAIP